ncbi:serine hydrolase [Streptomyces libani]|uniref:serine hydrolase n=1 Tax=Streptomyces TaxID=1883 RepID=UPI0037DA6CC8
MPSRIPERLTVLRWRVVTWPRGDLWPPARSRPVTRCPRTPPAGHERDRAALVLGYLAEYLSGQRLDELARTRIWRPLGMSETSFGPLPSPSMGRCAPTEMNEATGLHLKGTAHDFSARLLDGICGIAGVFSVLEDLASFLRHMLDPAAAPEPPGFGFDWVTESQLDPMKQTLKNQTLTQQADRPDVSQC